ncbi:hypothetical protein [Vibrio diabolicus]|uniref:hypothetical protein n=1 Tax=Vibrio diabolicus TaxID=50719 RepID=UPI0004F2F881|nr:hypothetical protein [Vibrio diabolicus]
MFEAMLVIIFLSVVFASAEGLGFVIRFIEKLLYEIAEIVLKVLRRLFSEKEQSDNKEVHTYDLDNDKLIINLESYNKKERLIVISEVCNVLRKENNNESKN